MKAIILAAGYGKRMGTITELIPKSLIPIVNKPILQHLIENLIESGLKECIIVVGHLKAQIVEFIMDYNPKEIGITIVEARNFTKGPLYSFAETIDLIKDEEFILIPSDFIFDSSILSGFIKASANYDLTLAYTDQARSGEQTPVILSEDGPKQRVQEIADGITQENEVVKWLLPLLLCRINIKFFIQKSLRLGHTQVIEAINLYLKQKNEVIGVKGRAGYWFDLDTIDDVLEANKYLLSLQNSEKTHLISQKFPDCAFNHPILIGENCYLGESCSIGPYVSIGNNTLIRENTQIQNSIIYPSSNIPANAKIMNTIFFKGISE